MYFPRYQKFIACIVLNCFLHSSIAWATAFHTPAYSANQIATQSMLTMYRNADSIAVNPASIAFMPHQIHMSTGMIISGKQFRWRGPASMEHHNNTKVPQAETQNPASYVPTFQIVQPGSKWSQGFSLKFPYNSSIRWENGWDGQGIVKETRIQTITLNPSVAYRFHPRHAVALGIGLNRVRFFARRLSPAGPERAVRAEALGWSYNMNLGYLGRMGDFILGAHYNSIIPVNIPGEIDFDSEDTNLATVLSESDMVVQFGLPWTLEYSIGWKDNYEVPRFEVELGVVDIGWSTYREVALVFDEELPILGRKSITKTRYRNTRSLRTGVNIRYHEKSILMAGFEQGSSAISSKYLSPTTPVGEMVLLGIGNELILSEKSSLSAAYALVIFSQISTDDTVQAPVGGEPFYGSYSGAANIFVMTYNNKF